MQFQWPKTIEHSEGGNHCPRAQMGTRMKRPVSEWEVLFWVHITIGSSTISDMDADMDSRRAGSLSRVPAFKLAMQMTICHANQRSAGFQRQCLFLAKIMTHAGPNRILTWVQNRRAL